MYFVFVSERLGSGVADVRCGDATECDRPLGVSSCSHQGQHDFRQFLQGDRLPEHSCIGESDIRGKGKLRAGSCNLWNVSLSSETNCQINFSLNHFVREGTEIVRFDGNLQGLGFIGSKSDHCIALSVSQSVPESVSGFVETWLIDVTLACENTEFPKLPLANFALTCRICQSCYMYFLPSPNTPKLKFD